MRRVQGQASDGSVPTALERSSGYTNLSDILTQSSGAARTDLIGRSIPRGTILDPATTRYVAAGATDPVSGLTNSTASAGYVRDPFGTCGPGTLTFTTACGLNQLPSGRLDANAIKLLNLYPAPNSGLSTYTASPNLFEHKNAYDIRGDINPSQSDQIFIRFSYADDPIFIPGIFGGVADGGSFDQGLQTAKSDQAVAGWTHVFNPNTINQVRAGFAHLHTTRFGPEGNVTGLPAQYGIGGYSTIGSLPENGGLPALQIGNLATLGSNNYLPSDEVSQTLQVTDDFTKILGKHSFKAGFEYQHVNFSTLQPASSHGQYDWNGTFTDIPNLSTTTGGMAQLLVGASAAPATIAGNPNPNGFSYSGGVDSVWISNIGKTYDEKMYSAVYLQDDWKVSPKLTVNLGIRWDKFGPINETNGGQANFVPNYFGTPTLLLPASGKDNRTLSTGNGVLNAATPGSSGTCAGVGCWGFIDLLAKDGIALSLTDQYGKGLLQTPDTNLAPRVGFAYQVDPKLVVRGGFGLFFNSFENQGYGPNIGENYPFQYSFGYGTRAAPGAPAAASQVAPVSYGTAYAGCPTAGPGGTASLEAGVSCTSFTPALVNALGLGLQGLQFNYQTPRTYSANLTLQYSITHSLSAQASYVFTDGQDLQAGTGTNNVIGDLPGRHQHNASGCDRQATYRHGAVPGLWRRQLPGQRRQQPIPRPANQNRAAVRERDDFPGHVHLLEDTV